MSETLSIPLNKLVPWEGNVRKTGVSEGVEELSASIAAHGLLQAPIVRKIKGGKYAVVAGQRRLLALKLLAEKGTIAADMAISCQLVAAEADAGEISLAENVVRVAMHPADQFEAFRDLVDRGVEVAAVAARFGVTENVVAKRMKLGRLSPVVLAAYRAGDIDLEEAQAFAISDDHQAQERVLAEVSEWSRNPSLIRRHLTEGEIPASDKRVRFVGLEAYEQAGGFVRRDLFDDEASGTLIDTILLDRLVSEKLSAFANKVRAEGWAWVEIVADFDRSVLGDYRRVHPERIELTAEQQALFDTLSEEYDTLADSVEADDGDEDVLARLNQIEGSLSDLEHAQKVWTAETLAIAGAIVTLTFNGTPAVERGLILRGDEPEDDTVDESTPREPAGISAALIEELTARKTAALRDALAVNVPVALAAAVHALALPVFFPLGVNPSCLQVTLRETSPERHIGDEAGQAAASANADALARWSESLPSDSAGFWQWCLAQPQETLLSLLAFVVSQAVNAVRHKADRPESGRLVAADGLAKALSLNMAEWFTPDVDNYFGRINTAQIVAVLCEAKGVSPAPSWTKMKKAELAALAAREIAGTGWLPEVLRARDPQSDELDELAA